MNIQSLDIPYQKMLNPTQLEAVTFIEGSLLVIAGAGSGKTRTLTYRVAYLVENNIPPASILLLTFTRKASQEMLERAGQLLKRRCTNVSGGTFHSFANSILRKYAHHIGCDAGFAIMDRADSENMISLIRKETEIAKKARSFPRKKTLANIFSRAINKAQTIDDIIFDDYPHFIPYLDDIIHLEKAYQQNKIKNSFFDYDDLLVYLLRLLQNDRDARERISDSFRYIMVDEYQDTNHIQADILHLLSGRYKNVTVVGDDSQSIYSFRGANFQNIFNFTNLFPETRIIRLEENYRSVQPILNLANVIIERAAHKYSKTLFTRKPGGTGPVLVDTASEESQSRFVAGKIEELQGQGVALNRMAVLFRASFHAFDLEIELARRQIPFIKVGGFKFVESAHIKDVLAYLKVIGKVNDRISWYRILLLLDNVGPKTAQNIYQAIIATGAGATGLSEVKTKPKWKKGIDGLRELFETIDAAPISVAQMGETALNYYLPILREKYDDHPKRLRDLEHLLTIMERYENLESFLTDIALEPPNTSSENHLFTGTSGKDRLTLTTVHSAKGLEWDTVFIIWALDGRFPSVHALDSEDQLEEELRLTYVATTRAEKRLFFVYPRYVQDRRSGRVFCRPSRFIDMIPEDILVKQSAEAPFS